jgi:hypothetical protein
MAIAAFVNKNLYWIAVKSIQLEIKNLVIGLLVYFSIFFFSTALILSGAFSYIGVSLFVLFVLYCFVVLALVPISFGSIISQYFFYTKEVINIAHIFFGVLFIFLVLILPIFGVLFLLLLYFYTFGIISRLVWYSL